MASSSAVVLRQEAPGVPARSVSEFGWRTSRPRSIIVAMKILISAVAGPSDPTRLSVPIHIAVNGCVPEGHEVRVVLVGDATELVVGDTVERVEGVGLPPMRELVAKLVEHEIPVHV